MLYKQFVKYASLHRMKCISLRLDSHDYLQINMSAWYCKLCLSKIFSFSYVKLFVYDIDNFDFSLKTLDSILKTYV